MTAIDPPVIIAQRVADQLRALLGAHAAAIYLTDANGDNVAMTTSGDLGPTFRPGVVFPRGSGIVGLVLREGQAVTSSDILRDPRVTLYGDGRSLLEQSPIRAVLGVPLIVQRAVLGAAWVGAAEGRLFTEAEVEVARALANQAAIAIENARLYRDSLRHQRRLATMVEVARKLTSRLDLPTVLETVAAAAADVFGADVGYRLIEGDELVLHGATPRAREKMVRERLGLGESISGRVAATGDPIVTTNIAADVRAIPEHRGGSPDTDALMCVPIRGGSRILGILNVFRERGQLFDDGDLSLALSLADQAGIALENARLYQRSVQDAERTKALAEITRRLSQTLDVEPVAKLIAETIRRLLGVHHAVIFRLEPESGDLVPLASTERLGQLLGRDVRLPPGTGAAGRAVADRAVVVSANVLTDSRIVLPPEVRRTVEEAPWRSILAVPLVLGDQAIGAVGAADREGRVFDDEDIRLAQAFAAQAAVALDNAKLYHDARRAYEDLARTQDQLVHSQRMEAVAQERERLARALHDALSAVLFSIGLKVDWCLQRLPARSPIAPKLAEIKNDAAAMMRQMRTQILQLASSPPGGRSPYERLSALTAEFEELSGIQVQLFATDDLGAIDQRTEELLRSILLEALVNVAKHGRASRTDIRLEVVKEDLRFDVSDDGIGPHPNLLELVRSPGHSGIRGMRERVEAAGGRLDVGAGVRRGFRVSGALPIR